MEETTSPPTPVTPETPAAEPKAPEAAQPAVQPPEAPDWAKLIETVDSKELRKHPKVGGIVGDMLNRERERLQAEVRAVADRQAAEEAEQRMLAEAESDPVAFSEKWLKGKAAERTQKEISNLRAQTLTDIGKAVGQTYRGLPEWAELADQDFEKLNAAVQGKPDHEVIGAFNLVALDIIAERRAAKRLEEWKAKELTKEREAVRKEEAAKLLAETATPGVTPPKGTPAKLNIKTMTDEEFDRYWAAKHRG